MSEDIKETIESIENPALVLAMCNLKDRKTKEAEEKFMLELKRARFLSPAIVEVKDENGDFQKATGGKSNASETRINFMMLSMEDGRKFLPAFTSMDEVRKWRGDEKLQCVVATMDNYISIINRDPNGPSGIVVDPFGSNIVMHRQLIEKMQDKQNGGQSEKIMIGDPKEFPQALADALSKFFDENGNVETAYLFVMRRGDVLSYLIILDYDTEAESDRRKFFDAIAQASKEHLNGISISIAPLGDAVSEKIITEDKKPFYTKNK